MLMYTLFCQVQKSFCTCFLCLAKFTVVFLIYLSSLIVLFLPWLSCCLCIEGRTFLTNTSRCYSDSCLSITHWGVSCSIKLWHWVCFLDTVLTLMTSHASYEMFSLFLMLQELFFGLNSPVITFRVIFNPSGPLVLSMWSPEASPICLSFPQLGSFYVRVDFLGLVPAMVPLGIWLGTVVCLLLLLSTWGNLGSRRRQASMHAYVGLLRLH